MPELAEVALFANDLNKIARRKPVTKISFSNQRDWGFIIIPPQIQKLLKATVGSKLNFESVGKALLLYTNNQKEPIVEFRLGMTGGFQLYKKPGLWRRHYFLTIHFGNTEVHFLDPRRFGRLKLPSKMNSALGGYSLKKGLWFRKVTDVPNGFLSKPKIKWLLEHGSDTGVGNYMANEALGRMDLSPYTPCKNRNEAIAILKGCQEIAKESYRYNGNSFGTGFFLLSGKEGSYSKFCRFYGNESLKKSMVNGRPVFSNKI